MATKYVFAASYYIGAFFAYRIDNQIGRCAERARDMYRELRTAIGRATGDVISYEANGAA